MKKLLYTVTALPLLMKINAAYTFYEVYIPRNPFCVTKSYRVKLLNCDGSTQKTKFERKRKSFSSETTVIL